MSLDEDCGGPAIESGRPPGHSQEWDIPAGITVRSRNDRPLRCGIFRAGSCSPEWDLDSRNSLPETNARHPLRRRLPAWPFGSLTHAFDKQRRTGSRRTHNRVSVSMSGRVQTKERTQQIRRRIRLSFVAVVQQTDQSGKAERTTEQEPLHCGCRWCIAKPGDERASLTEFILCQLHFTRKLVQMTDRRAIISRNARIGDPLNFAKHCVR